tara:strand:+ start:1054 stop:2292 length:1239 start_codon:yes stop_codon:yes gene_type:complete
MQNKLLVISYTFPPSNKVGGRRWSKFSKYLIKNNVDVRILTSSDNSGEEITTDFENLKDQIDFNYPKYLGINPSNILEKILYKFSLIYSKLVTNKNYYDKAVHGKKNLLKKVEYYINLGYNNVLVSIAPFHLATYVSDIILKYPKVNFIVDFRDPWVGNKTSYGYYSLNEKRKSIEKNSEKQVVERFNNIVSVSDSITTVLKNKYPNSKALFTTIPNGFDREDYSHLEFKKIISSESKIRLVFSGTFYDSAEKYLTLLSKWLEEFKALNKEIYNSIHIDFFGTMNIQNSIFNIHKNVIFHGLKSKDIVYKEILKSDGCLLFLTDDINYSFSSKFCDYIALKKPIIVFSNKGFTSKYIDENNIGHSFSFENSSKTFLEALMNLKSNSSKYYLNYNSKSFDLKFITKDFYKILI